MRGPADPDGWGGLAPCGRAPTDEPIWKSPSRKNKAHGWVRYHAHLGRIRGSLLA